MQRREARPYRVGVPYCSSPVRRAAYGTLYGRMRSDNHATRSHIALICVTSRSSERARPRDAAVACSVRTRGLYSNISYIVHTTHERHVACLPRAERTHKRTSRTTLCARLEVKVVARGLKPQAFFPPRDGYLSLYVPQDTQSWRSSA